VSFSYLTLDAAYHLINLSHLSGLGEGMKEIQVTLILDATKDTQLPSPIESFRFCQAVRRRRVSMYKFDQGTLRPKLQKWSAASSSSLITIGGSAPTRLQTKDLATEMVELIEAAGKPVIWALKGRQTSEPNEETQVNLLKQLTNQVVQLNNKRMIGHVSQTFNARRVQSARTESDWVEILKESLRGLSEIYFVIDMEMLGYTFKENGQSWLELFQHFEALLHNVHGVVVKVAILSFRHDFIRSLGTASPQTTIVLLQRRNRQSTSSKVKKNQAWRRRNVPAIRFG
jgi:hypothetical protein